jgi:hypothetical protein
MNPRRRFLTLLSAATPAVVVAAARGEERGFDGDCDKKILGTWNLVSTVSNGFSFREFIGFAEGGVLTETNSFLHATSNLNFAPFGFAVVANGSEGLGNWSPAGPRAVKATFRKMMFDSATGDNFGDLLVTGTVTIEGNKLKGQWHVQIVDSTANVLADLGPVMSVGVRLS